MRDPLDYVPLEAVLGRVFDIFPAEHLNEDKLLEWASQASEEIMTWKIYERALCFIDVENHKAPLPLGMYAIEIVLCKKDFEELSEEDISDITTVSGSFNPSFVIEENVVTFLQSPFLRNKWVPIAPSDTVLSLAVLCEDAPVLAQACEWTYTIDPFKKQFITNFEKGTLAVAHIRTPMNENGQFLIPNQEHFKNALEAYLKMKIWEWRMNTKEKGSREMYAQYKKEWTELSVKSVGEQMMPSLPDYANTHNQNKMVREDSRFAFGLGNLGFQETIHFYR
jgi:hypothetical protein